MNQAVLIRRAHARIGLLGNPSDSYYGKTLSLSLANFFAEVTLTPSLTLAFVPHPLHDGGAFSSLEDLQHRLPGEGYSGGVRLLKAACLVFWRHCERQGLAQLLSSKHCTLSYETNIPRQSGLAGSSAIVCAAMSCLMDYYDVADRIPVLLRPGLVLAAEQELAIAAGLQDRVVQVYGGIVYMNFDRELMQRSGGIGRYESLDSRLLPPLWLITAANPSDSGAVHSDVRRRWEAGDERVVQAMQSFASIAEQGRSCLERRDSAQLASLMDANFDLRREIFGEAVLGELNLKMIATARSVGAAAKFTGSGGAIVAFCPNGKEERLQAACEAEGFTVLPVEIGPVRHLAHAADVDNYTAERSSFMF